MSPSSMMLEIDEDVEGEPGGSSPKWRSTSGHVTRCGSHQSRWGGLARELPPIPTFPLTHLQERRRGSTVNTRQNERGPVRLPAEPSRVFKSSQRGNNHIDH